MKLAAETPPPPPSVYSRMIQSNSTSSSMRFYSIWHPKCCSMIQPPLLKAVCCSSSVFVRVAGWPGGKTHRKVNNKAIFTLLNLPVHSI